MDFYEIFPIRNNNINICALAIASREFHIYTRVHMQGDK